jgi:hypothetical protein
MSASPWPVIHAERTALADDLAAVDVTRWATPSLCPGWTVHDAASATATRPTPSSGSPSSTGASNLLIRAKRRISGLTLRATDTGWSSGSGPEVSGPMLSLLPAMTGRAAAVADLEGEGVATLRSRPAGPGGER